MKWRLSFRVTVGLLASMPALAQSQASSQVAPQTSLNLPETQVNQPQGGSVRGQLMFRGNPTRSWYGSGPLPEQAPRVLWRYPDKPMCAISNDGQGPRSWCGSGWTGQPVVWERPDGVTEVIVGTYDRSVHFINAETGQATRPAFRTGDIIKGSVTLDPDGFPLLYFGSRDNKLRILALDREVPTELWSLDANSARPRVWNDDWDGNPVVLNDHLFQGGENSWFYAFRLNRSYDSQRRVTVNPVNIIEQPGWTENLAALVGDRMFSIENSVALFRSFAFFANGGGLITGLDLSRISNRRAHRFFEFWAGDDIDSTITVDRDGQIYVAVERERRNRRNQEVGQLIKLNPFVSAPNQLVWSLKAPGSGAKGGFWATPALDSDRRVLYAPSHDGRLFAVHADTGQVLWEDSVGPHAWSSPVLVDGKLLLGLCSPGGLRLYDVSRPETKSVLWSIKHATGACIESTPAVWKGRFYVGSRDGYIYGFGAR